MDSNAVSAFMPFTRVISSRSASLTPSALPKRSAAPAACRATPGISPRTDRIVRRPGASCVGDGEPVASSRTGREKWRIGERGRSHGVAVEG